MEHTTNVTSQRKGLSAQYGPDIETATVCTPTGGKNTPEEATTTETKRQHAQIPDITSEEDIKTETEPFIALVQVMLHYSSWDADSTTAWSAPDGPHHETGSTKTQSKIRGHLRHTHAT